MKSLFRTVVEISERDRDAFYQDKCDDEAMRRELQELVAMHENESDFLDSPLNEREPTDSTNLSDPLIGRQIENFRISRRIGAGGMGVVFEAEQENPHRRAAIKLLHPGQTSEKMLWRFRHESEILARLQHPGVAHIYASGVTDFGHGSQPWFAMELVDGPPLHHYLSERSLSVDQKLRLLLQIADAVQHAHERGVIHRDLKPANIVISIDRQAGGDSIPLGCPRILDFGVARVVEESGDAKATLRTEFGEVLGTINYMSPERFAGDPSGVDHRCDVYALGVIGYEMLANKLPIDAVSGNISDAIRSIEQVEPQPLGRAVPALRGDLEVIFSKALEKDPERRYQSAREFADDIRRYLENEPITARPVSTLYRLRKFLRRNRVLVGGMMATVLALSVGMGLYAVEAKQARLEAEKSRYEAEKAMAINNFMTNDFFTKLLAAAQTQTDKRLPVAELVDEAAGNVSTMFGDRPAIEAAVCNEVGTIYYNIGRFDRCAEQFKRSLALWEASLGPEHPDTLKAVNNLGMAFQHLGKGEDAEKLYRRALSGRVKVLGEADAYTLATMNNLGELLRGTGRMDEAEDLLRRAIRAQEEAEVPDEKLTLTTMANLGSLLASRKRFDEAADLHRTVYERMKAFLGEKHITTLHAGSRYSQTLHLLGDYNQAKSILSPIADRFEQVHGPCHRDCFIAKRLMSRIERDLGNRVAAQEQLEAALSAASSEPERFSRDIARIERDIRRLAE